MGKATEGAAFIIGCSAVLAAISMMMLSCARRAPAYFSKAYPGAAFREALLRVSGQYAVPVGRPWGIRWGHPPFAHGDTAMG